MWIGARRVEFVGELVSEFGVEIMFDPVSGFVKMVGGDVEVAIHVALPQSVGSDQFSGGVPAGLGEHGMSG